MEFLNKLSTYAGKYMSIIVLLIAGIALFLPASFIWATPRITLLLGIVMFGMGITLKLEDFKTVFQRPKEVFFGCLAQFTIMPLLAFGLAKAFGLPAELAVGVILVGTCPGGTSSNVMTYLAKGDVALSVSMTMVSTLLAPILTPFLTWLFAGQWVDVSLYAMFLSIVHVVIIPIILGLIVHRILGEKVESLTTVLPLISVTAIVLIVGGVVSANASKILTTGLLIFAVVVVHNLLGYLLGYFTGSALGMTTAKKKAVAIEVGMQNSGLAASLAAAHFSPAAAIPGAIFSVWHNISGSIAANILSRRSDEKIQSVTND